MISVRQKGYLVNNLVEQLYTGLFHILIVALFQELTVFTLHVCPWVYYDETEFINI